MTKGNEEKLQLHMVVTDAGFFITDTLATEGYDYNYRTSKLTRLLVNGEKPKQAHARHWFVIDKEPETIQRQEEDKRANQYWELIDPDMESKALPLKVEYEEMDFESSVSDLYTLQYDIVPGELVDVPFEVEIITEVKNFRLPPKVNFKSIERERFKDVEVVVDNTNFEHQLLDKLIIPEVLIHEYPCKLPSDELYGLIRRHVKANIDNRHAQVTSDYDFCFTVKKLVPTVGPGKINNRELINGTLEKKEEVIEFKEFEIFEMTSESSNYKRYTPIQGVSANNQFELKEKVEKLLENLMSYINEPTGQEYNN